MARTRPECKLACSFGEEPEMIVYGHGAQQLGIAGSLLAEKLGELLLGKGIITQGLGVVILPANQDRAELMPLK